jgi:hypothetical protein
MLPLQLVWGGALMPHGAAQPRGAHLLRRLAVLALRLSVEFQRFLTALSVRPGSSLAMTAGRDSQGQREGGRQSSRLVVAGPEQHLSRLAAGPEQTAVRCTSASVPNGMIGPVAAGSVPSVVSHSTICCRRCRAPGGWGGQAGRGQTRARARARASPPPCHGWPCHQAVCAAQPALDRGQGMTPGGGEGCPGKGMPWLGSLPGAPSG